MVQFHFARSKHSFAYSRLSHPQILTSYTLFDHPCHGISKLQTMDPISLSADDSFLEYLPPEVWGRISRYLDVREVGRTYVGASKVIRRCLQAGVTHLVDWSDVAFKTRFYYWPARVVSASFVARFTYLKSLHLPYNTNITDADMPLILRDHMVYMDLSCNEELTDEGLKNLPRFLVTLKLKFSINVTDSLLSSLPRTLKHLDLDRCKNLTDEGLKDLPPTLETLCITFATQITDEGVTHLPKTLTCLQMAMNNAITGQGVRSLPPSLEILDLSHNRLCSNVAREEFPPRLKLLLRL